MLPYLLPYYFFPIFFKTHGVGTLWYFGPRLAT